MVGLSLDFWLVHAAASVAGSALVWGLGLAIERAFRLSAAAKGYWLAIWLMAVLPTGLALALQLMPTADLPIQSLLPLPAAIDLGEAEGAAASAVTKPFASVATLLALVYFAGLISLGARAMVGALRVRRIVRSAQPISPAAWPGELTLQETAWLEGRGIDLRMTSQSVTPFAVSTPRKMIVLPAEALARFDDRALRLIIRHEAAHLEQADPQRAAIMGWVGLIFWFNPFVRMAQARVQMAAELRCDALALADDRAERPVLARAYIETLKMIAAHDDPLVVTALAHRDRAGHRLRLQHMLHGDAGRGLSRRGRIALFAVAIAAVASTATLQFAAAGPLTVRMAPSPEAAVGPASSPARPVRMTAPLSSIRVTSRFEEISDLRSRPHRGTDFGARVGTSVTAIADGVVVAATDHYADGDNYGTVVVLDHGNGWQSLYAHLDRATVRVGQRISGGGQIAMSGQSGRVSGPHLHLEVLKDGQRVDPESVLS